MLQEDFRVLLVCSERSEGWSSGNSGQTLYSRCTADLGIVALLCNAGILRISKLSVFNTDGGFDSRRPTYNIFVVNSLQKKSRRNGRMNSNPKPFRIKWIRSLFRNSDAPPPEQMASINSAAACFALAAIRRTASCRGGRLHFPPIAASKVIDYQQAAACKRRLKQPSSTDKCVVQSTAAQCAKRTQGYRTSSARTDGAGLE